MRLYSYILVIILKLIHIFFPAVDTWKWNPNGVLLSGAVVAGVGYAIIGVAGVYLPT